MARTIAPLDKEFFEAIMATHQLPDAVTNALAYNAETRHFYALTYVTQLFAFMRN
jgi:hypothetical protein